MNNSMKMVIHHNNHQNNILHVSKCKKKETHFVDFHTKYNYLFLEFFMALATSLL